MKDYNNFMNEDKWSNIQNKQQQQKKNHRGPQGWSNKWQMIHFSAGQLYRTASEIFSLASFDVCGNNPSPILDFGIKKAFASYTKARQNFKVDIFQRQLEMQSWRVGSWSISVLQFPCFSIVWGKGQRFPSHTELAGVAKLDIWFSKATLHCHLKAPESLSFRSKAGFGHVTPQV